MERVAYTEFRQSLTSYLDRVCDTRAPLKVTGRSGGAVVVMSEHEYASIMGTLHLLGTRANASRLLRYIADADAGRRSCCELKDP